MKTLIIGSEGFIGQYLTKKLLDEGHTIIGMDLKPEGYTSSNCEYIQGDIMNKKDLAQAMEGVELVINLAAMHHDFGISRKEYFRINEDGTRNLLEVMSQKGLNKMVFYSSVAVYGDIDECSNEQMPANPSNDYGDSKWAAEKLISSWYEQDTSRQVLIVRPAVVFGPNNYANMYKLIDTIYKGRYFQVGKGDNIKSVCYVENLVDATAMLIQKMTNEVLVCNYSDYDHLTSRQIIDTIKVALGRSNTRWHIPLLPVLVLTSVIDLVAKITKINFPITSKRIKKLNMRTWHGSDKVRDLGFQQQVSIEDGLKKMVNWYLSLKSS